MQTHSGGLDIEIRAINAYQGRRPCTDTEQGQYFAKLLRRRRLYKATSKAAHDGKAEIENYFADKKRVSYA